MSVFPVLQLGCEVGRPGLHLHVQRQEEPLRHRHGGQLPARLSAARRRGITALILIAIFLFWMKATTAVRLHNVFMRNTLLLVLGEIAPFLFLFLFFWLVFCQFLFESNRFLVF